MLLIELEIVCWTTVKWQFPKKEGAPSKEEHETRGNAAQRWIEDKEREFGQTLPRSSQGISLGGGVVKI